MFQKSLTETTGLEKTIDELIVAMTKVDKNTPEYTKMVDNLDTLYKLKALDKPERVSRDTLAIVAGNFAGVLLIVGFERANVLTSKALSTLLKTH